MPEQTPSLRETVQPEWQELGGLIDPVKSFEKISKKVFRRGEDDPFEPIQVSTMNDLQQALFPMIVSLVTNGMLPASILQSTSKMEALLKSGELDVIVDQLLKDKNVFPGDRVADLTDTQKGILGSLQGFTDYLAQGPQGSEAMRNVLAGKGIVGDITTGPQIDIKPITSPALGGQVVGEDGPEVITATEDLVVEPAVSKTPLLDTYRGLVESVGQINLIKATKKAGKKARKAEKKTQKFIKEFGYNPLERTRADLDPDALNIGTYGLTGNVDLAVEQNQVGLDADLLLEQTGLSGRQAGGIVRRGQQVVVGEEGRETLNPLRQQTLAASTRALSGQPSTQIDPGVTNQFIQQAIADPLRRGFQEETKQNIRSAYAGPGFWGGARAKAETKAGQDVERQIGALGAQYRYQDVQAARNLSESAATRSAGFVPTALNVQANPLVQQQMQANIAATQAGTQRTQQLLPGEVQQQAANIGGTQFGTQRGQALLTGELGQQQANIAGTQAGTAGIQAGTEAQQFQTQRGQVLLPGELTAQLANTNLTQANQERITGLIQQDIANTGQITANTEQTMRQLGLTDATIEQMKATTIQTQAGTVLTAQEERTIELQQVQSRISAMGDVLEMAGLERLANQQEIDAAMLEWYETNPSFANLMNSLFAIIGEETTMTVIPPAKEDSGRTELIGAGIGAVGDIVGGILSDRILKKNLVPVESFFDSVRGLQGYIWEWNATANELGLYGKSFGLVAQEVQEVIPDAVQTGPDGYLTINYTKVFEYILDREAQLCHEAK